MTSNQSYFVEARRVNHEETLDGIRQQYNCRDAAITEDGMVWVADPMTGHYLRDEQLGELRRAFES